MLKCLRICTISSLPIAIISVFQIAQDIINSLINRAAKGVAILKQKRFREQELLPQRRVMIQQLNGNGDIDPASLLPVVVTPEHLVLEDVSMMNDEHEYDLPLDQPLVPEDNENQWDERVIYWLPRDVCLVNSSVLYFLANLFS